MNKLLLPLFTIFTIALSFAQPSEAIDVIKKEYDIRSILSSEQLDSITYIVTAQVNQKALVYMMLFKVDYDSENNSYSYVKLDHTHNEVYKSMSSPYMKYGEKIYRCRKKEEKTETLFYLDKLTGNRFEEAAAPFFKGSNEYAGSLSIFPRKKSFVWVTNKMAGSTVSTLTISEFSLNDFELIATDITVIPSSQQVKEMNHFENDRMLVYYYQYLEESKGKAAGIVLSEGKITHLKLEDAFDTEITCTMYSNKNNLFLSVFTRNTDDFKVQLYAADINSASFTKIADSPIPLDVLSKGYPAPFEKKDLKKRGLTFNFSEVVVDEMENVYIVLYSTLSISNGFTVIYNDLVILKFSENELSWTQQVKREGNRRPDNFRPRIGIEDKELKIYDIQHIKPVKGQFQPEFGITSISLDTDSGEVMK